MTLIILGEGVVGITKAVVEQLSSIGQG